MNRSRVTKSRTRSQYGIASRLRHRQLLEPQVAFQDLGNALADQQFVKIQTRFAA